MDCGRDSEGEETNQVDSYWSKFYDGLQVKVFTKS